MSPDITPFSMAVQAAGQGSSPASIFALAEGASVLMAHDVQSDDPRAIKIPAYIVGGDRSGLEAMRFVWLEEPTDQPQTDSYVTVRPPEHWTVEICSAYLTEIRDQRGIARVSLYNNHQFWDPFCKTTIINVGQRIASELVNDSSATLATTRWHALTDTERTMALSWLRKQSADLNRAAYWLQRLS